MSRWFENLGKWFDWAARILVIGFVVMLLYKVWAWWAPPSRDVYLRTDVVDAKKTDSLVTGFATLALVRFRSGDAFVPFDRLSAEADRIDGFCYRLYDLSIGYPSLTAAIEISEAAPADDDDAPPLAPGVLSANSREARHGGEATQKECDAFNLVSPEQPNEARLGELRAALAESGQWSRHVEHAQGVLVSFSEELSRRRREQSESRLRELAERREELSRMEDPEAFAAWASRAKALRGLDDDLEVRVEKGQWASQRGSLLGAMDREIEDTRSDLARSRGYLGSLRLTFSTIGIFSQEKGRWFWKRNEFYVRRDRADATYGSEFALDVSRTPGGFFGGKRVVVTIPEPDLLSLDRYTDVLVSKPADFELAGDEPLGSTIEAALLGDLEDQLSRLRPQAIRFAKAILTAQLHELVRSDVAEVVIRFRPASPERPVSLPELLALAEALRQAGER